MVEKSPPNATPAAKSSSGNPKMPAVIMASAYGAEDSATAARPSGGTIPTRNHWNSAFTAKMMNGERMRARGMLMCGYLISSPMAQHVSKPAKHHQIMATAAMNPPAPMPERKSGVSTKFGSETLGTMVTNQMIATPQKKNMKPFCKRPVICTPHTFVMMNATSTMHASTVSPTGSSTPNAANIVLK